MLESIGYVLLVFVGMFLSYILVRLVSTAYYRSKLEYMRDLSKDNKGDDNGV